MISKEGANLEELKEIFLQKNRRFLSKIKRRLEGDSDGSQEKHKASRNVYDIYGNKRQEIPKIKYPDPGRP